MAVQTEDEGLLMDGDELIQCVREMKRLGYFRLEIESITAEPILPTDTGTWEAFGRPWIDEAGGRTYELTIDLVGGATDEDVSLEIDEEAWEEKEGSPDWWQENIAHYVMNHLPEGFQLEPNDIGEGLVFWLPNVVFHV